MARRKAPSPDTQVDAQVSRNLGQQVRQMRKDRGWTLQELAAASGVSRSMLSQIERQQANPTLTVAFRIASAFGVALSELVASAAVPAEIQVVRAADRSYYFRSDRNSQIRTLSPLHLEKQVEFYELLLHADGVLTSAAHHPGTREFLTVQRGSVRVTSAGNTCDLEKGDSAYYPADVPHKIANTGRGSALTFLVVTYRE
ncbi:MAG: HTH-type transcriptional regulator SutR [Phycisphaerae bacterium]|nr:HTH-type transcriptional regulator SutR [Phycisphaerae bacterium]